MSGLAGFAGPIFIVVMCAINFGISFWNANAVGKIWTESKHIGGGVRILAVCGYIMSIAGFTMVYSIIIMAVVGSTNGFGRMSSESASLLLSFIGDLSYILIAIAIIPTGIIITVNSLITFWKNKNLRTGAIGAWNTFATVSNVVSATRSMPSAFGRLIGSVKSNRDSGVIVLAIVIVAICVLGGYFTASAILKRADRKYDLFQTVAPGYATAGAAGGFNGGANSEFVSGAGRQEVHARHNNKFEVQSSGQQSMAEREAELRRSQGM